MLDILFVVIVLADHAHLVRHEVSTVEAHAKLPDHGDVSASRHCLHKGLCATFGNSAQIVDKLILRHADARVLDGEGRVGLVRDDLDEEIGLGLNLIRVCDTLIPNLVQGIGSIGDQLAQEDLLVAVEGVDNQRHQLLDVSIEGLAKGCSELSTVQAKPLSSLLELKENMAPACARHRTQRKTRGSRAPASARKPGRRCVLPVPTTTRPLVAPSGHCHGRFAHQSPLGPVEMQARASKLNQPTALLPCPIR